MQPMTQTRQFLTGSEMEISTPLLKLRIGRHLIVNQKEFNAYLEKGCLMDDFFFELFFKNDPKYIQVVIHAIFKQLNKPLVKIISVSTQHNLKTFGGCDPRLDLLAEDEEGRRINIEVQRILGSSHPRRARYYSSTLDTNILPKGTPYEKLPETYVIFIMAKDFLGRGLPAYEVGRVYKDNGAPFDDGSNIIYINGEYRADDPIGRLMYDFNAIRGNSMKNKELAERMTHLKETESGRQELTGLGKLFFDDGLEKGEKIGIEKGRENEKASVVLTMLKNGFDYMTICTISQYPEAKVKELRDRFIREGLLPA